MIDFGGVEIDAVAYGSQGNAILGIRDSGKTYTATWFAEQLFDSGIPFVAFDPIGVWRFLRVPGPNGHGYPVVVAGGSAGDLQLTVTGAPEIVRAAMTNGMSLVIDLFDINLSKTDWKRIVSACVKVLLHENGPHGLRHIFLEEAAEFAPQRVGPDQGQVYAEIEKLARMGGNARLGYTLINQRAEEVNKAVLELCDNLSRLKTAGTINYPQNGCVSLVADVAPATKAQARDAVYALMSGPGRKLFDALGRLGQMTKSDLAIETDYSATSGNFSNLLSQLSGLGLIRYPVKGSVELESWAQWLTWS